MKGSLAFLLLSAGPAAAESGIDAWLRYAPLPVEKRPTFQYPGNILVLNESATSPVFTAGQELRLGMEKMLELDFAVGGNSSASIIVGTLDQYTARCVDGACGNSSITDPPELVEDGFWLKAGPDAVHILGQNQRGALYGAFEFLSRVGQGNFKTVDRAFNAAAPIRSSNQWDQSGYVGRGYGGPSIFFENDAFAEDLTRATQYARLLASVGINILVPNDANAETAFLLPKNLDGLARLADACRPWGVQLGLSLNFSSPLPIGGLDTYDPLEPSVIDFWQGITDDIYTRMPDFFGYLVKADSETQPGPLQVNRTLYDGANLFANALRPYGGVVMYRSFIYNYYDESNWYNDRAKDAYDYFDGLDGKFEDNVIIQIKYGPLDFQVREPPNPLFGYLRNTNCMIELQVTQEYLGQQTHLVYEPPLWKTILDFDMRVDGEKSLVRDIYTGKQFGRPLGGSAAVINVGTDSSWLGSIMAQSNFYAYGRLAWDPSADSQEILQDWIRLTFGFDQEVVNTLTEMSMESWPAYLNITGNLGLVTLTDVYTHYGPNPKEKDSNDLGLWTRGDRDSIGMDRTVSNGTGATSQYPPDVAAEFESLSTVGDDLLLWFHHVPYTHRISTGETVIQHIYDAHYAGAATIHNWIALFTSLRNGIDTERFDSILFHQTYQAGRAITWRDAICDYYAALTGIADERGRVGAHPYRIEIEAMDRDGYALYAVSPFETASNATAIVTATNGTTASVMKLLDIEAGTYDLVVNYFDLAGGQAEWEVYLNSRLVGAWTGDYEERLGHAPSIYLDGTTATRRVVGRVQVHEGDVLRIVGTPGGLEAAPLDYVSFLPAGVWD